MTELHLQNLRTEIPNEKTRDLDLMTTEELLSVMNEEDHKCAEAVKEALPEIAEAVKTCISALKQGGRMVYIGAGTSGRIGMMDSAECVPTFNCDRIIACLAGGFGAVSKGIENAEDNMEQGAEDLKNLGFCDKDVVIGIAASGRTPYVIGALKYAQEVHAKRIAVSCNKHAEMSKYANTAIEVDAGSEVLTGSTRLKSGTCQKLICNMLSTAAMQGIGKIYKNLMVDMVPTNAKLRDRAVRIISEASECSLETAREYYELSGHDMKTAIVMILSGKSREDAQKCLQDADGFVRKALNPLV